jgi:hypothetical protein
MRVISEAGYGKTSGSVSFAHSEFLSASLFPQNYYSEPAFLPSGHYPDDPGGDIQPFGVLKMQKVEPV